MYSTRATKKVGVNAGAMLGYYKLNEQAAVMSKVELILAQMMAHSEEHH